MQMTILPGIDLTNEQITLMNRQRIAEYGENTKDFRQNEQESIFFFLSHDGDVKAFEMLKSVTITYQDNQFSILGIGNIIAREKGQGYGRMLMHALKTYLDDKRKTGLGFCDSDVCGFYARCGYDILTDLTPRFRYLYSERDGQQEKLVHNPNILYFDGGDHLHEKLRMTDDLVYIDVPFW